MQSSGWRPISVIPIPDAEQAVFPQSPKGQRRHHPEGEALTLKSCQACQGGFLGDKFQTKCAECRITTKRLIHTARIKVEDVCDWGCNQRLSRFWSCRLLAARTPHQGRTKT